MQKHLFLQKAAKSTWFISNCFELLKTGYLKVVCKLTDNKSVLFFKAMLSENLDGRLSNTNTYHLCQVACSL